MVIINNPFLVSEQHRYEPISEGVIRNKDNSYFIRHQRTVYIFTTTIETVEELMQLGTWICRVLPMNKDEYTEAKINFKNLTLSDYVRRMRGKTLD